MRQIQAFHLEFGEPNDAVGITQFFALTNQQTLLTKSFQNQIFQATTATCQQIKW